MTWDAKLYWWRVELALESGTVITMVKATDEAHAIEVASQAQRKHCGRDAVASGKVVLLGDA